MGGLETLIKMGQELNSCKTRVRSKKIMSHNLGSRKYKDGVWNS